ncbi:hypothetical protein BCEN4_40039 [Burkholderia cenocepacia]|nr:hypothetical protein BCEN4_40039 [Burkholderia cenocepacia]
MADCGTHDELIAIGGNVVRSRHEGNVQHASGLVATNMLIRTLEVNIRSLRQVVVSHQPDSLVVRMLSTGRRIEIGPSVGIHRTHVKRRCELVLPVHLEVLEPQGRKRAAGRCDGPDVPRAVRLRHVRIRIREAHRCGTEAVIDAGTENAKTLRDEIFVTAVIDGAACRCRRIVRLQIGCRDQQSAARILRPHAVLAVVRKICVITEAIRATELEARKDRTRIFDRVVHTKRVVGVVVVIGVREHVACPVPVCRRLREIVDERIVLTTERNGAEPIACKADICLAAEHKATLPQTAVVDVEPILELEDGFQPAADVFRALHSPSTPLHETALEFINFSATDIICEVEALVDETVERDRALGMRGSSNRGQDRCRNNFLHSMISKYLLSTIKFMMDNEHRMNHENNATPRF